MERRIHWEAVAAMLATMTPEDLQRVESLVLAERIRRWKDDNDRSWLNFAYQRQNAQTAAHQ